MPFDFQRARPLLQNGNLAQLFVEELGWEPCRQKLTLRAGDTDHALTAIAEKRGFTAWLCPARSLPQRVPPEWNKPLAAGRLLLLSAFTTTANRVTAELAARRNEFVAALANEVFIAHAANGGHLEILTRRLRSWGISFCRPLPQPASHN